MVYSKCISDRLFVIMNNTNVSQDCNGQSLEENVFFKSTNDTMEDFNNESATIFSENTHIDSLMKISDTYRPRLSVDSYFNCRRKNLESPLSDSLSAICDMFDHMNITEHQPKIKEDTNGNMLKEPSLSTKSSLIKLNKNNNLVPTNSKNTVRKDFYHSNEDRKNDKTKKKSYKKHTNNLAISSIKNNLKTKTSDIEDIENFPQNNESPVDDRLKTEVTDLKNELSIYKNKVSQLEMDLVISQKSEVELQRENKLLKNEIVQLSEIIYMMEKSLQEVKRKAKGLKSALHNI